MAEKTKARGWKRHLDGWQAGAIVLLLAGSAIVLGLPKAVAPNDLPMPTVNAAAVGHVMEADDAAAARAVERELDVDVRALGSAIRAYNAATAAREEVPVQAARETLLAAARTALSVDKQALLALRAYQMLRFIEELGAWTKTGQVSEELVALGGDFTTALSRNAWCKPGSRALVMSQRELRVMFKKRWNEITGLHGPTFDLTVDEDRIRYAFLLRRPFVRVATRNPAKEMGKSRLDLINKLAALDAAYPALVARGVVMYQMGQFAPASEQFRKHLELFPDGPGTLRIRNYLKAALDMANTTM